VTHNDDFYLTFGNSRRANIAQLKSILEQLIA